jgi:hypothetical protein
MPTNGNIRRATEVLRRNLGKQFVEIVSASDGLREVQILTPESPTVYLSTEPASVIGDNRTYNAAALPPTSALRFRLLETQRLFAAAGDGQAHLTVIIEYPEEG